MSFRIIGNVFLSLDDNTEHSPSGGISKSKKGSVINHEWLNGTGDDRISLKQAKPGDSDRFPRLRVFRIIG